MFLRGKFCGEGKSAARSDGLLKWYEAFIKFFGIFRFTNRKNNRFLREGRPYYGPPAQYFTDFTRMPCFGIEDSCNSGRDALNTGRKLTNNDFTAQVHHVNVNKKISFDIYNHGLYPDENFPPLELLPDDLHAQANWVDNAKKWMETKYRSNSILNDRAEFLEYLSCTGASMFTPEESFDTSQHLLDLMMGKEGVTKEHAWDNETLLSGLVRKQIHRLMGVTAVAKVAELEMALQKKQAEKRKIQKDVIKVTEAMRAAGVKKNTMEKHEKSLQGLHKRAESFSKEMSTLQENIHFFKSMDKNNIFVVERTPLCEMVEMSSSLYETFDTYPKSVPATNHLLAIFLEHKMASGEVVNVLLEMMSFNNFLDDGNGDNPNRGRVHLTYLTSNPYLPRPHDIST
jgi:hypothetical protein